MHIFLDISTSFVVNNTAVPIYLHLVSQHTHRDTHNIQGVSLIVSNLDINAGYPNMNIF